jgi:hypothetical protein
MTSSVAFSNYANVSVDDPNGPSLANSNYNIPQRFSFRMSYSAYWWGDNRTNFTLVGAHNKGRPFSYTFARDDGNIFGDFISDRHSAVRAGRPERPARDLRRQLQYGGILRLRRGQRPEQVRQRHCAAQRFDSDWWTWFDLRIEQEFPVSWMATSSPGSSCSRTSATC